MTEMVAPAESGERKLYARKTSGLIRTIGVFGAMVFGVHCISLSSSGLIPYSWIAGVLPGSSIIGVLTVAAFFCLFHAYTYATIGAAMPRSAAYYTLASRVLSPPLAFAASWTLVIFSAMVAGALIAWIPLVALPTLTRSMGIVFSNPGLVDFAAWSASKMGIFVIGTVCAVITFVTMILPTRTIVRILEIGFFLGLLAWVILYFQLGTASTNAFPAAWNHFMGEGSYEGRVALAQQYGMQINPNVAIMTLAGLIMGFWVFYGYYIPTFFAGVLSPSFPLVLIVAVAWIYTLINLAQTYFFYCSRIIFAWSFDRLIPEAVSYIHPKLRSPIIAILIITIIGEIGIIDAATGGVMGAQLNFVFFAVCTMLIPVLAMTLFPYLKPDLYQSASAAVRRSIGKVPVITIVGVITLAYLLWMIIASFLYPAVGGRIGSGTLITLAAFFLSGIAVFYIARAYRLRKEGIDINWTFSSVPPV